MMTMKILTLLTEAGSLTAYEVAKQLNITEAKARSVIADMRERGYVESRPTTYSVTDEGKVRQQFKRKVYVKKGRQPRKPPVSFVDRAIKTQPNSVFALGAM